MSKLAVNDTVFLKGDGKKTEKLIIRSDNDFKGAVIRVIDKNGKK